MNKPRFEIWDQIIFDGDGPCTITAIRESGHTFEYCFDGIYWGPEARLASYME